MTVIEFENLHDPFATRRRPAKAMTPVVDPAGWTAADLTSDKSWLYHLDDAEIDEIRAAVAPHDYDGVDVMPLGRDDFQLPILAERLARIRDDVVYGSGYALIRGLPVADLGKRGAALAFWAVGQHLGDGVWSQNDRGHVLGHVTDIGQSKTNPNQRGPYSSESLPFHADCADIVGLLCLETPVSGGESSIASAVTVYNEMLKRHPDLVRVLFEPYYRDRRGEIPPGMKPWYKLPIFNCHEGYFSASIEPTYISSADRFQEVPEMTPAQREAFETVQDIAAELRFDAGFDRGDMQYLNNHVIFHTRRAFEDHGEPERKRHLLRIWLKILDGRPLPDAFYERHGRPGDLDRPGGIVGPDTILNAPLMRT
jgi:hypothetical protein